MIQKFLRRPIEVEAVQHKDYPTAVEILNWMVADGKQAYLSQQHLYIQNAFGEVELVGIMDWVVRNGANQFNMIPNNLFQKLYIPTNAQSLASIPRTPRLPVQECFYRFAPAKTGACLGPVNWRDEFGNSFCTAHRAVVIAQREADNPQIEKDITDEDR